MQNTIFRETSFNQYLIIRYLRSYKNGYLPSSKYLILFVVDPLISLILHFTTIPKYCFPTFFSGSVYGLMLITDWPFTPDFVQVKASWIVDNRLSLVYWQLGSSHAESKSIVMFRYHINMFSHTHTHTHIG